MKEILFVGIGGFIGSISRYSIGLLTAKQFGTVFLNGTLFVNLLGSLLIGILAGYFAKSQQSSMTSLILITGFCGGFTTFSTFSLDNLRLLKEQMYLSFALYGVGSVVGGLVLCTLGYWIVARG